MFNSVIPLNVNIAKRIPIFSLSNEFENAESHLSEAEAAYANYALEHYTNVLLNNSAALKWFSNRKIELTTELIKEFHIGFADSSLGKQFQRSSGRKGEIVRGAWQWLGIVKPSGYQFFLGDVVIPFYGEDGVVTGAYGRRISPENRARHIYFHHWIGGDVTFFNLQALSAYNQIIYCKNPIEALTFICAGIPNAISPMGMYSFEEIHLRELEKYHSTEVVLALDNSDAGNHVSGLIAQILGTIDINCFRMPLPRNQDVNSFACEQRDYKEALAELVEDAYQFKQSFEMFVHRR